MSSPAPRASEPENVAVSADHRAFARSLPPEEKQLVVLRDELYEGSWEEMQTDLESRRDGRPYIYKLINRIDEDLARIARLEEYETRHEIDLGEYIEE